MFCKRGGLASTTRPKFATGSFRECPSPRPKILVVFGRALWDNALAQRGLRSLITRFILTRAALGECAAGLGRCAAAYSEGYFYFKGIRETHAKLYASHRQIQVRRVFARPREHALWLEFCAARSTECPAIYGGGMIAEGKSRQVLHDKAVSPASARRIRHAPAPRQRPSRPPETRLFWRFRP